MKKTTVLPAIALLLGGASLVLAGPAFAEDGNGDTTAAVSANDQVCTGLDSGKIDVNGEIYEVELTAPEGNLITGYCVKAGSINNGNGPVYVELDEPVASLTITYKDGTKAISHYSYSYAPIVKPTPTPTPTPEPTPEPTPTPTTPATTPATTPPAGGGDGGATLAETGFDAGWLPFAGIGVLALGAALVTPRLVAKRR
jgi:hypothetical protein